MKKLVCLLLVVVSLFAAVGLAGCGEKRLENEKVIVSYDYEYFTFVGSSAEHSQIEKVEFRGNYTLVTIYYKSNANEKIVLTTSTSNIRLYYSSDVS